MVSAQSFLVRWAGNGAAFVAASFLCVAAVSAQSTASSNRGGRVEFEYADLPPAAIEVDLSQGLLSDVFGIGDAAVAGVTEAVTNYASANNGSDGVRMSAEKLTAVHQIVQTLGQVVREIHVRAYKDLPEKSGVTEKLLSHFDEKLHAGNWENVVRAQEKGGVVRVAVARGDGTIQGLFVVVANGRDVVLTNLVCDLSPDKVKTLTSIAAKTGLEAGLGPMLEAKMRKFKAPEMPQTPGVNSSVPAK